MAHSVRASVVHWLICSSSSIRLPSHGPQCQSLSGLSANLFVVIHQIAFPWPTVSEPQWSVGQFVRRHPSDCLPMAHSVRATVARRPICSLSSIRLPSHGPQCQSHSGPSANFFFVIHQIAFPWPKVSEPQWSVGQFVCRHPSDCLPMAHSVRATVVCRPICLSSSIRLSSPGPQCQSHSGLLANFFVVIHHIAFPWPTVSEPQWSVTQGRIFLQMPQFW
jgi:hypothetical protein